MEGASYQHDEPSRTLPAHAALIPAAERLDGAPQKGWYFTVLVRAAYLRLGGIS